MLNFKNELWIALTCPTPRVCTALYEIFSNDLKSYKKLTYY